jgi:hypothetical protein
LLYPNFIVNLHILNEFKDFHDHTYKISKGEEIIWKEFYILILFYSLMVISYFRTALTNPGRVPDEDIWSLSIPENIPVELQSEFLALTVEKREEMLQQNKNILAEININETSCSGKGFLI